MLTLGEIIKERRLKLDWPVKRLAIELGRSKRTIQNLERNKHTPCDRTIGQILKIWPDLKKHSSLAL